MVVMVCEVRLRKERQEERYSVCADGHAVKEIVLLFGALTGLGKEQRQGG